MNFLIFEWERKNQKYYVSEVERRKSGKLKKFPKFCELPKNIQQRCALSNLGKQKVFLLKKEL